MRTAPFHRVVYELLFLGFLKALRQFTFLFPFSNIYMDEEYREHLHRQWKKFIAQVFWEKKKREIEKKKWSKKKKGKMLKVHYFFKGEVICLFFPSLCAACLLLECVSSTSISWRGLDGSTVWAIPGISEFKNKQTNSRLSIILPKMHQHNVTEDKSGGRPTPFLMGRFQRTATSPARAESFWLMLE